MRTRTALFVPLTLALAAGAAGAHEGHGLPGASHWHASDLLGFGIALAVALALLWIRRK
jgi:hypothetical protein